MDPVLRTAVDKLQRQFTALTEAGKPLLAIKALEKALDLMLSSSSARVPRLQVDSETDEATTSPNTADDVDLISMWRQEAQTTLVSLVEFCNSNAVRYFTDDDFNSSVDMLSIALFHTDVNNVATSSRILPPHVRDGLRSTTYNNQGCLERRRRNFIQAEKLFLQAIATCASHSAVPMVNLSALLTQIGKLKESAAMAKKAIAKILALQNMREHPDHSPGDGDLSMATAAASLQPGLLAVGYHALAVSLETLDPKGALDNYDLAIAAAQRELPEPSSAASTMAENKRRYVAYLQRGKHMVMITDPAPAATNAPLNATTTASGAAGLSVLVPTAPQHGGGNTNHGGRKSIAGGVRVLPATHGPLIAIPPTAAPVERFTTPQVPPAISTEVRRSGLSSVVVAPAVDGSGHESGGVSAILVDSETVSQRHNASVPSSVDATTPGSPLASTGDGGLPSSARQGKLPNSATSRRPGAAAAAAPKAPPPLTESALEETRRKDDIVTFMMNRLGLLLKVEDAFQVRYVAARRIQALARPFIAKVVAVRRRAMLEDKQRLLEKKIDNAARCIQRFFRLVMRKKCKKEAALRELEEQKRRRRWAATTLQKYTRRWLAIQYTRRLRRYKQIDSERSRACMRWFQAIRSRINSRKLGKMRQQICRDLMRKELEHRSASLIQATYRMHRQYLRFLIMSGQPRRALVLDRQKFRAFCATKIQSLGRRYIVRTAIGPDLRRRVMRRHNIDRAQKAMRAAESIQRHYRGFIVRKRMSKRLQEIRERSRRLLRNLLELDRNRKLVRLQAWARMLVQRQKYRCLLRAKRDSQKKRALEASKVVYELVQLE